ncbi:MAG: hypothetical protein ACQEQE_06585 [Bacillota bacterium]
MKIIKTLIIDDGSDRLTATFNSKGFNLDKNYKILKSIILGSKYYF